MRRTTILLAAVTLALAGCSSSGDDEPAKTVTVTATQSPSLSAGEKKQACMDAWLAVMTTDGFDTASGLEDRPAECEGLPEQMEMYTKALMERNEANRERIGACVEDPTCTGVPIAP